MVLWYGNKLCDAGFVINLSNREERMKRTISELEKSKIEGVQRFDACVINEPEFVKYGCTQSHIEIAKKQIENNWEYVLYLEDDIISDFFYDYSTDNSKIDRHKVSQEIISGLNEKKPDVLWLGVRPETYTEKVTDCFVKPKTTLMSHAYLGSIRFAKFLVEYLKYDERNHFSHKWPIDFFISQINVKDNWTLASYKDGDILKNNNLEVLMTTPMIFNQGHSFSDLLDRNVNYVEWVQGCYSEYVNTNKLEIKKFLNE